MNMSSPPHNHMLPPNVPFGPSKYIIPTHQSAPYGLWNMHLISNASHFIRQLIHIHRIHLIHYASMHASSSQSATFAVAFIDHASITEHHRSPTTSTSSYAIVLYISTSSISCALSSFIEFSDYALYTEQTCSNLSCSTSSIQR